MILGKIMAAAHLVVALGILRRRAVATPGKG
jgi:hypothetical protein